MFYFDRHGTHKAMSAGVLTAAIFCSTLVPSASADPERAGHKGTGNPDSGQEMRHGKGHDMHALRPHNAAEHFLKMAGPLKLTDGQIKQLTQLRDDYIQKNAASEDQLKAAFNDLGRALYADDIDVSATNGLLEKIGKLDGQLWPVFVQQLHDIKALLTPEQKKTMKTMWEKGPHAMEKKPGEAPRPKT